jgi:hypothetical protein
MARAVRDHWHPGLTQEPAVAGIAEELRRAAHDLRLLVEPGGDIAAAGRDLPALTRPLVVATPPTRDWIMIGALLEDLRRVREEISGE